MKRVLKSWVNRGTDCGIRVIPVFDFSLTLAKTGNFGMTVSEESDLLKRKRFSVIAIF